MIVQDVEPVDQDMTNRGTVLLVDNKPGVVRLVERVLADDGYRVIIADGHRALQVAHDKRPDVIVLDVVRPLADGIDLGRRLRVDPVTADIPIIAMATTECLQAAEVSLPMDDQLPEPFAPADVSATVSRWVPDAAHLHRDVVCATYAQRRPCSWSG